MNFYSLYLRLSTASQLATFANHRLLNGFRNTTTKYRGYRGCRAGRKTKERRKNLINCIPVVISNSSRHGGQQRTWNKQSRRHYQFTRKNTMAGNLSNLIPILTVKRTHTNNLPRLRLGTWNAHSINRKAASICDLIISKRIDILSLTETWLTSKNNSDSNIAEILNTLQDFNFLHHPRLIGKGGGVGVLLRKGLNVQENPITSFQSMEYLDLSLSYNNSHIRLITVHRPPPSKKNKLCSKSWPYPVVILLSQAILISI